MMEKLQQWMFITMVSKQDLPVWSKKNREGQSFFEVVLALALVSIILIALVTLATISVRSATFSRNKNLATRFSQEAIEWLRGQRDTGWSDFFARSSPSGATWCLSTLNWSHPGDCSSESV